MFCFLQSYAIEENGIRGTNANAMMSKNDADSTWQNRPTRTAQMSADTGSDIISGVSTMLNVSALWCGDLLIQPANHIALSHEGFLVPLKSDGRGTTVVFVVSVKIICSQNLNFILNNSSNNKCIISILCVPFCIYKLNKIICFVCY